MSDESRDGRRDIVTRNETGLLPAQQEILEAMAEHPDWREASDSLERPISHGRIRRWLREDGAFRRQYELMFESAVEVARLRVNALSEDAVETLGELLKEERYIEQNVKCPECDHGFKYSFKVKNSNVRARAAELITRASGVLKDISKVEHEGEVLHLTFTQKIGLGQLRAGQHISAPMLLEFQALGLVDAAGNLIGTEPHVQQTDESNVVDGESREIEGDETDTEV